MRNSNERSNLKRSLLTEEDKKVLRYQMRPGFIFPVLLMFIGLIILFFLHVIDFFVLRGLDDYNITEYSVIILLVISGLVGFLFTRNYLSDLKNEEKEIIRKQIGLKESIVSHEAGSGSLHINQKMNSVDVYAIVIDNIRYKVDKAIYDACIEGGFVNFHIAPKSKYLIKIEPLK